MIEIIALIIFLFSFFGIAVIIYRKVPVLTEYVPEIKTGDGLIKNIKEKLKDKVAFKAVNSGEAILLKMLSKSRVLVLKTEHKIGCWLSTLRQKSIEKEKCFKENYWEKIKMKKRGKKAKTKKEDSDTEGTL
jgi:hypothetical protein